jgi:hypothetical protein
MHISIPTGHRGADGGEERQPRGKGDKDSGLNTAPWGDTPNQHLIDRSSSEKCDSICLMPQFYWISSIYSKSLSFRAILRWFC